MRNVVGIVTLLGAAAVGQVANAADGKINFSGELVGQTCTVAVDGVVSPSIASVTLPSVSAGALPNSGDSAGRTGFNIQLSNCAGAATTAAAFFESGSTVDPVSGYLRNASGTASNVNLRLIDAQNGSVIKAGNTNQKTLTSRSAIDGSGNAVLSYAVEYVATAAAPTPGTVESSVTYSIDYQ
ncbi:major type 1 subunit fimbrin (pilin) [Pseudomonas delhiensis]|uniref:Major type 1 subunit fimbrin (Pilin) n=1 Tax=Pseudomonas delhiensis TaxID=366289 RepID=A0A239KDR8_9PSED|nr:fimbrial protein [Pseudomonas delhiensis]SDJ30840.1 major type 1 subunit fimbrin (pilin) [Pseudomonas delhiensis]SNT15862.1 major type 1 subunit fimbrin (pilin) [Pseudomonas delhiensis]